MALGTPREKCSRIVNYGEANSQRGRDLKRDRWLASKKIASDCTRGYSSLYGKRKITPPFYRLDAHVFRDLCRRASTHLQYLFTRKIENSCEKFVFFQHRCTPAVATPANAVRWTARRVARWAARSAIMLENSDRHRRHLPKYPPALAGRQHDLHVVATRVSPASPRKTRKKAHRAPQVREPAAGGPKM